MTTNPSAAASAADLAAPLRVGIGGPVGSGKTALLEQLCKRLRDRYRIAAITNDIYTQEDAQILTRTGALVGTRIPESLALDFAMPIAFLAMIGPMLRTPAHVIAALVAIVTSILAVGIPYNLGLLVAGTAGMMAGARAEVVFARKEART